MNGMRVDGAMAVLRPAARAEADADATRPDAWLAELERARWSAQPRYHGGCGDSGKRAAGESASAPAEHRPAPHADVPPSAEPTGAHDAGATKHARESHAPIPAPRQRIGGGVEPEPAFVGGAATVAARAPVDAARKIAARVPLRPVTDSDWAARSVHVHVGEQSTAVWVRDARLQPQDAVRLLEQLRPLLAQDHPSGKPIRLSVNGTPVEAKPLEEIPNGR